MTGVIGPAFFDEWNQERAGFFCGAETACLAVEAVGVRLDGCGGGEDEGFGLRVAGLGPVDARRYDTDDRNGDGLDDLLHGQGGGGVAGDYQVVCALSGQETCAFHGVTGDGLLGLGSIGETGGIAQVEVMGSRDALKQGAENGEAAEAGVEDSYGGGREGHYSGLPSAARGWMECAGSVTG